MNELQEVIDYYQRKVEALRAERDAARAELDHAKANAQLLAECLQFKEHQWEMVCDELRQARVELAALRERRCETCQWWEANRRCGDLPYPPTWRDCDWVQHPTTLAIPLCDSYVGELVTAPDFCCAAWERRAVEAKGEE